ncbi:IS1380 family transposase [Calditrichota bacterium LG25]
MDLKISFTDKEITPWGGMVLLKNMLDQIGLDEVITSCPYLPQPGSNRGYSPNQIIKTFLVSVWCGANRFFHTEITRHDRVLNQIFGWEHSPGNDTYKRYFSKFTQSINQEVFTYFYQWFFKQLKFDHLTLDFDSTILTRYGQQEGAVKGYNTKKPGRASHHPLLAFVADVSMVSNFWLRRGDANTSNNFLPFLEDTLNRLKDKKISLVRLDSGFYDQKIFSYLEEKGLSYIIAAKMYKPLQRKIYEQRTWLTLDEGVEITETMYKSYTWKKARRLIIVRRKVDHKQSKEPIGKQLTLFKEEELYDNYRYSCYITNLDLSAADVWRLYRQRSVSENRIKELKYDFGFQSFNLRNFWGTEAALNFAMIAYNLMSLFRQFILNSKTQQRLSTLRYRTFSIGAYLVKDGRYIVLKLALALKRREWFTGLWEQSKQFSLPVQISNA